MTEISFHFNVPDRAAYACRLLRKALAQRRPRRGDRQQPTTLDALDRELWAFEPVEFVPHVRVRAGQARGRAPAADPVWLAETMRATSTAARGARSISARRRPRGFESFARLIEIVSTDEDDRVAGARALEALCATAATRSSATRSRECQSTGRSRGRACPTLTEVRGHAGAESRGAAGA